jgi:hypothetical protein
MFRNYRGAQAAQAVAIADATRAGFLRTARDLQSRVK